ncbi:MAG: hypothetical protein COA36_09135 [Desulfotalea sp.]|nr:MAG: hypothetical protein COA36_09135 [Desulfotalea sp.]
MNNNTSKISRSMLVVGEIVSESDLLLEGEIRGSFVGRSLVVSPSGRIVGAVEGGVVECAGHMEGNVVTNSLKLKKGGCQVGTVVTGELEVEAGAVLDCVLHSGSVERSGVQPTEIVEKEVKRVDLSKYLGAFKENQRPCCFDVPWSERLDLYNHILDLLRKGKPLIKVVGNSGSGKSVLVQKMLAEPLDNYVVLELLEKIGSVTSLLKEVALSLGLASHEKLTSQGELVTLIRLELVKRWQTGERVVLLIDDAETMFQASMEGVIRQLCRACGSEEDQAEKYLQIILLGTGEMEKNMVATVLEYFEDETNCQLSLEPLSMKDTADYLRLGLQLVAPGDEAEAMSLLSNEAIKEIHVRSSGSIAVVNSVMDVAVEQASVRGENYLSSELVKNIPFP